MGIGGLGGTVFSQAVAVIRLDTTDVAANARTAQSSLRQLSETTTGLARGMNAMAGALGVVGGVIIATLGAAATEFIAFNRVVQDIASLGPEAAAAISTLQGDLADLAVEMGKRPVELAEALRTIASAGFDVQDSFTIVQASAIGATAGLTDVATAANAISSILLAYGRSAEEADDVSNVLFATVQVGRIRFEELARVIGTLAPTARALNISLEEVGASLSSMTNQGLSARQAAFQLNSLMQVLVKPTKALAAAMRQFGVESFESLIATQGFGAALEFLNDISGQNSTTLSKLLGNQRATRAAMILNTEAGAEYLRGLDATNNAQKDGGAAAKAFAEQQKALGFQIDQARAAISRLAISIGSALAPAISIVANVVETLAGIINSVFNFLPDTIQTGIITIIAFAGILTVAAAGAVLFRRSMLLLTESMAIYTSATVQAGLATQALNASFTGRAIGNMNRAFAALSKFKGLGIIAVAVTIAGLDILDSIGDDAGDSSTIAKTLAPIAEDIADGVAGAFAKVGLSNRITDALEETTDKGISDLESREFAVSLGLTIDAPGLDASSAVIRELGLSMGDIRIAAEEAGISTQDYIIAAAKAAGVTTEQLTAIEESTEAFQEQAAAEEELIRQEEETQKSASDLTDVIDTLGKKVGETDEAFRRAKLDTGITAPLTATGEAFKDFVKTLEDSVASTLQLFGELATVEDPLAFLRDQLNLTTGSIEDVFLTLEGLGAGVNFTDAQREALGLYQNLVDVDNIFKELSDDMAATNEEISRAEGNINFVEDALGSATDTMTEYRQALAEGKITQEEFDEAVASGEAHETFAELNELVEKGLISQAEANEIRKAGFSVIEQEQEALERAAVAQARQVVEIDKYLKKHKEAQRAVANASDDQQAFVSILQDQNTQQALNTVQMLTYLASIGQIPQERVTQAIIDLSAADPKLAALFEDLGLLNDGVDVQVTATIDEAQQRLLELQTLTNALISKKLDLEIQLIADPGNKEVQAQLDYVNNQIEQTNGRRAEITTAINSGSQQELETALANDTKLVNDLDGTTANVNVAFGTDIPEGAVDDTLTAIADEIAAKQARIEELSVLVRLTPEEAENLKAELGQQILDIERDIGRGFTIAPDGSVVKLTSADLDELNAKVDQLKAEQATVDLRVGGYNEANAEVDALNRDIDILTQDGQEHIARVTIDAQTPGINSLQEAKERLEAEEIILSTDFSEEGQRRLAQVQTTIRQIDAAAAQGATIDFTVNGQSLLQNAANLIGEVAVPREVVIETPAQDQIDRLNLDLEASIANVLRLEDVGQAIELDTAGADALKAEFAEILSLTRQKILIQVAQGDTSGLKATREEIGLQLGQINETNDAINQLLEANPNVENADFLRRVVEQNIQQMAELRALSTFSIALETGDAEQAITVITDEMERIQELRKQPMTATDRRELDLYLQTLEQIRAIVEEQGLVPVAEVQATFAGDPAAEQAIKAGQSNETLPGTSTTVTVNTETEQDPQQAGVEAGQEYTEGVNQGVGRIVTLVEQLRAFNLIDDNQLAALGAANGIITDEMLPSIEQMEGFTFTLNGQEITAFQARLNLLHEGLDETFGPRYTAFLDANGDGVVTELEIAEAGLEDYATRWTAFLDLETLTAQDRIDFIEQRLADLNSPETGLGGRGIDYRINADQALSVIKGVNNRIVDARLNENLLVQLDANADGYLDAVELAQVTGENLASQPFTAVLEMEVTGDERLFRTLNDVQGVAADVTEDGATIAITATSDEDVARFLDVHARDLPGKNLKVSVINPDGSVRTYEEYEFEPKLISVTVDETEFQRFQGTAIRAGQDGVDFIVNAVTEDAAQEFLEINATQLDGKNVEVRVLNEATGEFEEVNTFQFDPKEVPIITDPDANVETEITADNTPAVQTAQETPAVMQQTIDEQAQPTVTVTGEFPTAGPAGPAIVAPTPDTTAVTQAQQTVTAAEETINASVVNITASLTGLGPVANQAGLDVASNLSSGLTEGLATLPDALAEGFAPFASYMSGTVVQIATGLGRGVGIAIDTGIIQGIQSGSYAIAQWAAWAAAVALNAAKQRLGIASPSREAALLGGFFSQGLAEGILSESQRAALAARTVAQQMITEFESQQPQPMTFTGALGSTPASIGDQALSGIGAFRGIPLTGIAGVPGAGGVSMVPQTVTIQVNGARDPQVVADEVMERLNAAANRFNAGGGVVTTAGR